MILSLSASLAGARWRMIKQSIICNQSGLVLAGHARYERLL